MGLRSPFRVKRGIFYAPRNASLKHPRRQTSSGSLEEQTAMAKSSMVASAISQNLFFSNPKIRLPLKNFSSWGYN
jgi:hypothetical protein